MFCVNSKYEKLDNGKRSRLDSNGSDDITKPLLGVEVTQTVAFKQMLWSHSQRPIRPLHKFFTNLKDFKATSITISRPWHEPFFQFKGRL
jgi:hypothetical protein